MEALLEILRASKSYNGVPVLTDAALTLHAGEVHALVGENGAGKSTLIKLLAGVVSPDVLHLKLQGRPIHITSSQSATHFGLRFIHQELNVVPYLSVAENIFLSHPYPRAGIFVRWRKLYQKAAEVLAQLGVQHLQPQTIMGRLSPGDQMLVKIAAAFVQDENPARVYVMDEPTAALTGEESDQLFRLIQNLQAQGSAVLYVSHRLDEIFKITQNITVMRNGRVMGTYPTESVTPAHLISLMTGRELAQTFPPRETPLGDNIRLKVENLRNHWLHNLHFEIREGEIVGVAGLIGAGRTELLRVLMGASRRQGKIYLEGRPVRRYSPMQAWQKGIAFVPEERRTQGLILSEPIASNTTLPALNQFALAGSFLQHRREYRAVNELSQAVQLKSRGVYQHVWQLSGGNQQKVVFARALLDPPRVLLLDEPTRGVDVGAKVDLYQLIRQISGQGTSILMASSELSELIGLCDRILVLRHGQLVTSVPTEGLTESHLLSLCYGTNDD